MLDKSVCCFAVDVGLFGWVCEDSIIGKTFDILGLIRFGKVDLVIVLIDCDYRFATSLFFFSVEWSYPHDDFDALTHFGRL